MEIVRDVRWNAFMATASTMFDTEELRIRMANSFWKFERQQHLDRTKKLKTKFLEKVPVPAGVSRVTMRCHAVNLNNTPCQYKAVCGQFCRKHQIVGEI